MPLYDPTTGQVRPAQLFVAVLGASNYTYAEATLDQQMGSWIGAHVRALEFFGGCPQLVVPDNTRTGVSRACRYEPDLNPTYQEMAMHYAVGVLPTRPRKPRDKAKVEVGVQIAERWIVAALRHRKFFSLGEMNRAIGELLDKLNQRPFKKREGSPRNLFEQLDRPALRPLPVERFDLAEWSQATVNIDYHIQFDKSFYSVPYQLARQTVEVRATPTTVEIFHQGKRVASHLRTAKPYAAVTDGEHRACCASCTSGLAAIAAGPVGSNGGPANARNGRENPPSAAASGDGLSSLPGDHPPGAALSSSPRGRSCRTRIGYWRGQLQEHGLDPAPQP